MSPGWEVAGSTAPRLKHHWFVSLEQQLQEEGKVGVTLCSPGQSHAGSGEREAKQTPASCPLVWGGGRVAAFHYNGCLCQIQSGRGVVLSCSKITTMLSKDFWGPLQLHGGGEWCLFWVLENHSRAGNDKPPVQSSSSSCSQARLLCAGSAQPDPGNYSANKSECLWGFPHTQERGKGNFSCINAVLTAKKLSSFEIAWSNRILHFLGSLCFLVCFTTNQLFSIVLFYKKNHFPQTSTKKRVQMQSSGKFRGEALKQCKLQRSDPSRLTLVQEEIGRISYELAHMMPVSSHHMQGSKSSGLRDRLYCILPLQMTTFNQVKSLIIPYQQWT